jgi:Xaa-Pro aminopeptidase
MAMAGAEVRKPIPFDVNHLDKLLDAAGIDVLVATSKHNVQYLLGDYKFFFFEAMDAIGVSRYLPAVVYQKGKPEPRPTWATAWRPTRRSSASSGPRTSIFHVDEPGHDAACGRSHRQARPRLCAVSASKRPSSRRREKALRRGLSNVDIVDAFFPLERLRAVKSPKEIEYLQIASDAWSRA